MPGFSKKNALAPIHDLLFIYCRNPEQPVFFIQSFFGQFRNRMNKTMSQRDAARFIYPSV
jgi:hypothetical protein